MTRDNASNMLAIFGTIIGAVGLGLIYVPLALIAISVVMLFAAVVLSIPAGKGDDGESD